MLTGVLRSAVRRFRKIRSMSLAALPSGKQPLRIAIQGLGVIGRVHAEQLTRSNFFEVVGICSRSAAASSIREQYYCECFRDLDALLARSKPDVLLIATPHLHHREPVLQAIGNDVHVLCEKPLVVRASELAAIQSAAANSSTKITVMSQTRFEPSYLKAKQLLDSDTIGPLIRCNLIETFLRSQAYYENDGWRGTWDGEGGGVLVNQAPHVLDRYRWLCGCPTSIVSSCKPLRHDIEVEDSVTMICNHDNGMMGTIHVSTNEPPQSRLELVGDRGSIDINEGAITVRRWSHPISEYIRDDHLPCDPVENQKCGGRLLNWSESLLHGFYEDFALSIWNKTRSMVSLEEAVDVVQMIIAGHVSNWRGEPIKLPVEPDVHDRFLAEKQALR